MPSPNILLRPLTGSHDDLEFVRNLRNQNRHCFFDQTWILDWQQREWFKRISGKTGYNFYLIKKDGFVVGTISQNHLFDIDFKGEQTPVYEIGNLMMVEPLRGCGIMPLAISKLMSKRGFFVAYTRIDNDSSIRVFEKAGFATIIKRRSNAT